MRACMSTRARACVRACVRSCVRVRLCVFVCVGPCLPLAILFFVYRQLNFRTVFLICSRIALKFLLPCSWLFVAANTHGICSREFAGNEFFFNTVHLTTADGKLYENKLNR